jgi:hypothetical protein
MAKVDLYEFSDLLDCAVSLGYNWNTAHEILGKDGVSPMYGQKKTEFYINDCLLDHNPYDYSEDTIKILQAFFKQEGLKQFVII